MNLARAPDPPTPAEHSPLMQNFSSSLESPSVPSTPELQAQLDALYAAAESSRYVFASPLGPIGPSGRGLLPRFVFFGPYASDDAWRLCILAGVSARDHRSTLSVLRLAARLATNADDAHALNLTFFPQLGLSSRRSAATSWQKSRQPEIGLLRSDAQTRDYHGFIRIETTDSGDSLAIVAREGSASAPTFDATWFVADAAAPFGSTFKSEHRRDVKGGPLSFDTKATSRPFEIVLGVPAGWSEDVYDNAVSTVIRRFLHQYRAYQAFGGHL